MSPGRRDVLVCSCDVRGEASEDTVFDPACPFHGENGTMVALIELGKPAARDPGPLLTGGLRSRACPHCGRDVGF